MSIAQKILAEPGKYSIQQLTQAVQNGVLPAYIGVPIIQDKMQQQKQAQMGQQAQQAPQGQPSLAQQVMTEAQGVEALPTNLPQSYAGGGIVAFEEGGSSNKYETPYDRMNRLNREAEESSRLEREARAKELGIMPYGEQMRNLGSALVNIPVTGIKHLVSAPGYGFSGPSTPAATPTATSAIPATPAVTPVDATSPVASDKGAPTKGGGISELLSGLGLGGTNQGIGIGGESALGRAPGVGIKPPSTDLVGQTQSFVDAFNKRDEARTAENERRIQELQGSVKGKAYEGLEKSLQKEAEEFGADKAQAKNMAIFKAGLAMMAGTSRHALENIGKGAMVGAEDYQIASKDLKKAQKENERAMAMVEQARRAEDLGQRDKAIDRMDRANQHLAERDKFGTTALMNATGKSAELSQDAWKTMMTNQTHLAAANVSGKYHLASSILGAMGKERMTPFQEATLREKAEKRVDADALRAQLAKSLGLTKVPAPGADKGFDSKFGNLYESEVASHLNRFLGAPVGGAGQDGQNPYAGYKIVP